MSKVTSRGWLVSGSFCKCFLQISFVCLFIQIFSPFNFFEQHFLIMLFSNGFITCSIFLFLQHLLILLFSNGFITCSIFLVIIIADREENCVDSHLYYYFQNFEKQFLEHPFSLDTLAIGSKFLAFCQAQEKRTIVIS